MKIIKDNILLIGGTGFIGKRIAQYLDQCKCNYISINRNRYENFLGKQINVDFSELRTIKRVIKENKINTVIILAWINQTKNYLTDSNNIKIQNQLVQLIEEFTKTSIEKLIIFGTAAEDSEEVYGNSDYRKSKIKFKQNIITKQFKDHFNLSYLKPYQVYGEGEKNYKFITSAINNLRDNIKMNIKFSRIKLDWIHVSDVAFATLEVIRNDLFGDIPVGTGIGTSPLDVYFMLATKLKIENFEYSISDYDTKEILIADLSSSLFKNNWKPEVILEDGLNRMIASST